MIGVTRIGDNETVAHVRATLATITEGEGSRGREGMNERVIDRIVIRRWPYWTRLGHLMHVLVPSPWISVSWMREEGDEDRLFRMEALHNRGSILALRQYYVSRILVPRSVVQISMRLYMFDNICLKRILFHLSITQMSQLVPLLLPLN